MFACIVKPPARSAAKRIAARTVPTGCARPNNATVIASNPNEPAAPAVKACSLPRICTAPPSPANAPQITMTEVITNGTDIPAVFAANVFAPTARNWKPHVVRFRRTAIPHATKSAIMIAKFTRNESPARRGNRAFSWTSGAIGSCRPFRRKVVVESSQSKKYEAT